jgi:hypothetical protein
MFGTRPARLALLGLFVLAAAGCRSNSCGERNGWFSRFRHNDAPPAAVPFADVPCCGPEIPGLPPFPAGPAGNLPPAGVLPGPAPGFPPTGPMPGTFQPGEAQPLPYAPQSGRGTLPARTTGK